MNLYDFFLQVLIPLGQFFEESAIASRWRHAQPPVELMSSTQDALNLLAVRVTSQRNPYPEPTLTSLAGRIRLLLSDLAEEASLKGTRKTKLAKLDEWRQSPVVFNRLCTELRSLCWNAAHYQPENRAMWMDSYITVGNPFTRGNKTSNWRTLVHRIPARSNVLMDTLWRPSKTTEKSPTRRQVVDSIRTTVQESKLKVDEMLHYLSTPRGVFNRADTTEPAAATGEVPELTPK